VAGTVAAICGLGVYSLPVQTIVAATVTAVLLVVGSPVKPGRVYCLEPLRKVWGFAGYQLAFSIVLFFTRNIDSLLIGKTLGPGALGHYNKAYQLMLYPEQVLAGVIQPVLQPVLSDYQDDVATIRRAFLRIFHLLALISLPLSVFLALSGEQIIFSLFGHQWQSAIFPFSVLAMSAWCHVTRSPAEAIYQARNKTSIFFLICLGSAVFVVGSLLVGLAWGGIDQVAIVLSAAFAFQWLVFYALTARFVLDSTLGVILRQIRAPVIIAVVSAVPLLALNHWLAPVNELAGLALRLLAWATAAAGAVLLTGEHRKVLSLVRPNPPAPPESI
jgi:O-antigen/teichoic acid export membrane protein